MLDPQEMAKIESLHPSADWDHLCLKFVRTMLHVPARARTAYQAWVLAGGNDGAYTHTVVPAPASVPVFWAGRPGSAGHVALSAGNGKVWSSDIMREGKVDLVDLHEIHRKWGLRYLGWSETLNGVRVYHP